MIILAIGAIGFLALFGKDIFPARRLANASTVDQPATIATAPPAVVGTVDPNPYLVTPLPATQPQADALAAMQHATGLTFTPSVAGSQSQDSATYYRAHADQLNIDFGVQPSGQRTWLEIVTRSDGMTADVQQLVTKAVTAWNPKLAGWVLAKMQQNGTYCQTAGDQPQGDDFNVGDCTGAYTIRSQDTQGGVLRLAVLAGS